MKSIGWTIWTKCTLDNDPYNLVHRNHPLHCRIMASSYRTSLLERETHLFPVLFDLSQDFPDPTTPDDDETPVDELTVQPTDNPTPVETRPSRHRRPTYKLMNQENDGMTRLCTAIGCMVQRLFENSPVAAMHTVFKEKLNDTVNDHRNRLQILDNTIEMNVDGSLNNLHPLTFVAKSGKNDTFHFNGALQQDDREEFIKVMVKELEEHHRNKHWKLVLRSTIGEAKTVKAI